MSDLDFSSLKLVAKILDLKTGKRHLIEEITWYGWTKGHWSCDCNRGGFFDIDEPCESKRYIVIDVKDLTEPFKTMFIKDANKSYIK